VSGFGNRGLVESAHLKGGFRKHHDSHPLTDIKRLAKIENVMGPVCGTKLIKKKEMYRAFCKQIWRK
jgi:hypothetical protein